MFYFSGCREDYSCQPKNKTDWCLVSTGTFELQEQSY